MVRSFWFLLFKSWLCRWLRCHMAISLFMLSKWRRYTLFLSSSCPWIYSQSFVLGIFLIPYLIFLFLLGIPLFYLEVNLGQFTSQGAVQCWRMAPIFKGRETRIFKINRWFYFWNLGLGISMSIMSFFLTVYYAMLCGYSILYFVLSFRSKLDWAKCNAPWASISNRFDLSKNTLNNFFLFFFRWK